VKTYLITDSSLTRDWEMDLPVIPVGQHIYLDGYGDGVVTRSRIVIKDERTFSQHVTISGVIQ
jgi:3D (Asp-Asp-Asp) domain-containing protein